jgi:cell division protein FtsL
MAEGLSQAFGQALSKGIAEGLANLLPFICACLVAVIIPCILVVSISSAKYMIFSIIYTAILYYFLNKRIQDSSGDAPNLEASQPQQERKYSDFKMLRKVKQVLVIVLPTIGALFSVGFIVAVFRGC